MDGDPEVLSFGCRLNAWEGEVMRARAREAGGGDLVIVNSCAVTAEAERQARRAIRSARRRRPGARIVVTGCAAQIAPARFAAMPEVDRVLGNHEKLLAASWRARDPVRVGDIASVRETAGHLVAGFESRTRAFLQVQNGCDHRCTFCVIPLGRGPSRSVPPPAVVEQLRALVAAGVPEIVLCGVDLTAYGADLPERPTLGRLVRELLRRAPELPRLRLSSLDPAEIDAELWEALAWEPRLMPHLHLSLQAGDDLVLRRMKRRHRRRDVLRVAERARRLRPDVALGADLIAGFPGESDAMFERSLELVEACGLVYLHVFPYSERPDTPAARMPPLPVPLRRERAARLRAAGERSLARFLAAKVGAREEVLVEGGSRGRTRDYAPVALPAALEPGRLARVRIRASRAEHLVAEALGEGA